MLIELSLFASAFLSATLLPGSSEAALIYALQSAGSSALWLIAVASIGNTLGAATSWGLARYVPKRFAKRVLNQKGADLFNRYGLWSLLLTWVPIIGDVIPIAAGLAKTPLWLFAPITFIGKAARYAVIAMGTQLL
jgi:membrane protein YqaA with SNARE-associated domain